MKRFLVTAVLLVPIIFAQAGNVVWQRTTSNGVEKGLIRNRDCTDLTFETGISCQSFNSGNSNTTVLWTDGSRTITATNSTIQFTDNNRGLTVDAGEYGDIMYQIIDDGEYADIMYAFNRVTNTDMLFTFNDVENKLDLSEQTLDLDGMIDIEIGSQTVDAGEYGDIMYVMKDLRDEPMGGGFLVDDGEYADIMYVVDDGEYADIMYTIDNYTPASLGLVYSIVASYNAITDVITVKYFPYNSIWETETVQNSHLNEMLYSTPLMTVSIALSLAPDETTYVVERTLTPGYASSKRANSSISYIDVDPKVSVYPNPVSESLNFKISNDETYSFDLFDLTGRVVLTEEITRNSKINIQNILASGVYTYAIRSAGMVKNSGNLIVR